MLKGIKLIIGLGNPDPEYQNTFHNIGHMAIENLESRIQNLELLKTDVYMNQSGRFVKEALKKYKVKPENLLIIHDDSDIELGAYKFSFGRGSAGHKGVQNIINQLKTKDLWRLRLGIRPLRNKEKADKLVLRKISPANQKKLALVFKVIAEKWR